MLSECPATSNIFKRDKAGHMPITAAELTSKAMVNCPEDLPAQTGALQVQSVFAKNACRGLLYPKSTSNVLRLEKSTYTWSTWNVTTPVFQVCKLPSMSCLELISLEAAMLNSVEPLGLSTTGPQVYSSCYSPQLQLRSQEPLILPESPVDRD